MKKSGDTGKLMLGLAIRNCLTPPMIFGTIIMHSQHIHIIIGVDTVVLILYVRHSIATGIASSYTRHFSRGVNFMDFAGL
jgi:hypothetical protein